MCHHLNQLHNTHHEILKMSFDSAIESEDRNPHHFLPSSAKFKISKSGKIKVKMPANERSYYFALGIPHYSGIRTHIRDLGPNTPEVKKRSQYSLDEFLTTYDGKGLLVESTEEQPMFVTTFKP